jgi:hypothetical protein
MTLVDDGNVMFAPGGSSFIVKEPLPPFATKLTDTGDADVEVKVEVEVEEVNPEEPEEPGEPELEASGVHCA